MRFERENVQLTEFGGGVSFDTRIKNIRATLNSYATEMKPAEIVNPEPAEM